MMTRSQYSQALAVLERLANANESQAELLRAIQDDLTELRAVKREADTSATVRDSSVYKGFYP